MRSGKTGDIFMDSLSETGWEAIESGTGCVGGSVNHAGVRGEVDDGVEGKKRRAKRDKEIKCFSTRAVESFEVLNVSDEILYDDDQSWLS